MIKIIKDGQKEFIGKCSTCGCEFSYQIIDIGLGSVMCPCCGHHVVHKIDEFEKPTLATDMLVISRGFTHQTMVDWPTSSIGLVSSNNDSRFEAFKTIHDLCVGYDGFNTDDLKLLIADIRRIAEGALK